MDKKGRFVRRKVTVGELKTICGNWFIDKENKLTPVTQERLFQLFDAKNIELEKLRRKQIWWVSLAFILGTIFFMIIAKTK